MKYNLNLGIEVDTTKLEKAFKDIDRLINELNKKGTLHGAKIGNLLIATLV